MAADKAGNDDFTGSIQDFCTGLIADLGIGADLFDAVVFDIDAPIGDNAVIAVQCDDQPVFDQ